MKSEKQRIKLAIILKNKPDALRQICTDSGMDYVKLQDVRKLKNIVFSNSHFDELLIDFYRFYVFPNELELICEDLDEKTKEEIMKVLEKSAQVEIKGNEFLDFRICGFNNAKAVLDNVLVLKNKQLEFKNVKTRIEILNN